MNNAIEKRNERNRKRRARYAATKAKKKEKDDNLLLNTATSEAFESEWDRRRKMSKKSRTYRAMQAKVKSKEL